MTSSEIEKIQSYFREGQTLWKGSSKLVRSRRFYELWESAANPEPFEIRQEGISLDEVLIVPPGKAESCRAFTSWDDDAESMVLNLETSDGICEKYLLRFSEEGKAEVIFQKNQTLSGEEDFWKYDAAQLIIGKYQASGGELNFSKFQKRDFRKLLELLPETYPSEGLKALKKLKLDELKSVFERTLSDRAADELGSQMELPLFGTYSREEKKEETEIVNRKDSLSARTFWQVSRMFRLLSETDRLMIEFERNFELYFQDAVVVNGAHPVYILSLEAPEGAPIFFDDILDVRRRSDDSKIGSFRVDFFDGVQILGRLTVEDSTNKINTDLCEAVGTLIRGPSEFLKERLDSIREELKPETALSKLHSGGIIAGLSSVNFHFPENVNADSELNLSQKTAFETAVNEENPLVLIQGPPGTGKTHVLRKIVRKLHEEGKRIIITAPSHAAVDNICRGISDLPYLRCGRHAESIAPDILPGHWIGERDNVKNMRQVEKEGKQVIYAGTHPALLKDLCIKFDFENIGPFDVIIFDEAGMSNMEEVILCAMFAKRAIMLGDYKQLPPFPKPQAVMNALTANGEVIETELLSVLSESAMEWLVKHRECPSIRLSTSYRCQNPRLLRFISGSFYNAGIKPDTGAEYYSLPLPERERKYPPSTLRWISTSQEANRRETVILPGRTGAGKPGICNRMEANICVKAVKDLLKKYPLNEITIITPYRAQTELIRQKLTSLLGKNYEPGEWKNFLTGRVSTVDSFQGGESDAVIISYVRSNPHGRIGFTDHPNRINVAHTRCRCELVVIGDLECLKKRSNGGIFTRLEQAFLLDGEIVQASQVLKPSELQPELF